MDGPGGPWELGRVVSGPAGRGKVGEECWAQGSVMILRCVVRVDSWWRRIGVLAGSGLRPAEERSGLLLGFAEVPEFTAGARERGTDLSSHLFSSFP